MKPCYGGLSFSFWEQTGAKNIHAEHHSAKHKSVCRKKNKKTMTWWHISQEATWSNMRHKRCKCLRWGQNSGRTWSQTTRLCCAGRGPEHVLSKWGFRPGKTAQGDVEICRRTDWTIGKPERWGMSAGSSSVTRGKWRRGEPRKTWSVQRGRERNGNSSSPESRSGITEAFPVHIITHAFRGRVAGGGGWEGGSPHSNYQTIKMTIGSQLHFLQANGANFSQVSHVHLGLISGPSSYLDHSSSFPVFSYFPLYDSPLNLSSYFMFPTYVLLCPFIRVLPFPASLLPPHLTQALLTINRIFPPVSSGQRSPPPHTHPPNSTPKLLFNYPV